MGINIISPWLDCHVFENNFFATGYPDCQAQHTVSQNRATGEIYAMAIKGRRWPLTACMIHESSMAIGPVAPMLMGGGFIELAILFFILAIIAAVVGLGGVAGISMQIAKIFVVVFLVLAIISLLL